MGISTTKSVEIVATIYADNRLCLTANFNARSIPEMERNRPSLWHHLCLEVLALKRQHNSSNFRSLRCFYISGVPLLSNFEGTFEKGLSVAKLWTVFWIFARMGLMHIQLNTVSIFKIIHLYMYNILLLFLLQRG